MEVGEKMGIVGKDGLGIGVVMVEGRGLNMFEGGVRFRGGVRGVMELLEWVKGEGEGGERVGDLLVEGRGLARGEGFILASGGGNEMELVG